MKLQTLINRLQKINDDHKKRTGKEPFIFSIEEDTFEKSITLTITSKVKRTGYGLVAEESKEYLVRY